MKYNNSKCLLIFLLLIIFLSFVVSLSFSQDLPDLIKRAENNYKNFNQDFQDLAIIFDAKISSPDGEMSSEMKLFIKGEKSRSETLMQLPASTGMPEQMRNMLVIVIFDGQDAWMISPFVGKNKLTEVQAEEQMHYQTGMNWWKFVADKTKYVGIENVRGKDCYLLELEIEGKSPYSRMWVEKNSLFLVQAEGLNSEGDRIQTIFSDFKNVTDNWELPYKVEVLINEVPLMTVMVKSLKINKGISDEIFDIDKVNIQGPNLQDMIQNMMKSGGKN